MGAIFAIASDTPMAKAAPSLHQTLSRATATFPQPWINLEGLRLAKIAAKAEIKAQGLRLKDYEHRELQQWALLSFQDHRAELLGYATLELLFAGERSRKRAKLVSDAPKIEA
jgi:hypothetical protein